MEPARPYRCLRVTFALSLLISACALARPAHAQATSSQGPFTFDGDLRSLPIAKPAPAAINMPSPSVSFDGMSNGGNPPDTNGDVGPNHYIQAINTSFAIYSKTGTLLAGPTSFNTLFAAAPSTGTPCDSDFSANPIVLYDPLADRWVLTIRAVHHVGIIYTPPFYECIAVSKTPDPVSGGWHKYALQTGTGLATDLLNNSPRLAVWPDAYYMSANMYRTSTDGKFDHVRVWALDRAALLAGGALREVHFDVSGYISLLPSNLRGAKPSAGSPNYFLSADYFDSNTLHLWRFHVDFDTPANSWFGANSGNSSPTNLSVNNYTIPTYAASQPGTSVTLNAHADQLMPPVQYRNINGTESLWANHTVQFGSQLAIRWYEIRSPNSAPAVYQQGTFSHSGDAIHRWMGALAVDRFGDMAIGYSVSKPIPNGVYPGIRYAGRLVTDTVGLLPQSEITLTAGTGPHTYCDTSPCTTTYWGEYTSMSVDPTDDCTFWYTNQYGVGGNPDGYNTRIGSFRYPVCANANLVVDRSDDGDTRGCTTAATDCSLRGAINILNGGGFAGAKITFDPSITRINPTNSLPTIIASHNAIQGLSGSPRIDGSAMLSNTVAFAINAADFSLSGLSVVNLDPALTYGVRVLGGTRVSIYNNYLGTLPSGATNCTPASPPGGAVTRNAWMGILVNPDVTSSSGLGNGSVYIYNNTIACHDYGIYLWGADGVHIGQTPSGTAAPNVIGLNSGGVILPNHVDGVTATSFSPGDGANDNTISDNTIANNGGSGIVLYGTGGNDFSSTASNSIYGNRIYSNGADGIWMQNGAYFNLIGGTSDSERNLIYGNGGHGINVANSAANGILGNTIGGVAGGAPNAGHGVLLNGGYSNWVGGFFWGLGSIKSRNIIGENNGDGVQIVNGAYNNIVSGNYIGVNISGAAAAGNGLSGVAIYGGAHNNLIGGYDITSTNTIAGNARYGVYIAGSMTSSNTLSYNDIGLNSQMSVVLAHSKPQTSALDSSAVAHIPNGWDGLTLQDGAFGNVITNVNWIAYNSGSGVYIAGGAHDNTFDMGNRVSNNALYGFILDGNGTQNNVIRKAYINNNGLDGIGERNSATDNRWSMLSVHHNGGMGIDKEASSDSANMPTTPHPVITAVVRSGDLVTVSGTAQPSFSFVSGSTVEVYAVSVNAKGFGEGGAYLGAAATDAAGNWSLAIPDAPGMCYVAFESPYGALTSSYFYSTEFSPNNCRLFAPVIRKET